MTLLSQQSASILTKKQCYSLAFALQKIFYKSHWAFIHTFLRRIDLKPLELHYQLNKMLFFLGGMYITLRANPVHNDPQERD